MQEEGGHIPPEGDGTPAFEVLESQEMNDGRQTHQGTRGHDVWDVDGVGELERAGQDGDRLELEEGTLRKEGTKLGLAKARGTTEKGHLEEAPSRKETGRGRQLVPQDGHRGNGRGKALLPPPSRGSERGEGRCGGLG